MNMLTVTYKMLGNAKQSTVIYRKSKVDLFNDETIEASTIQDFRDISRIFTSFSQNFKVPASETNNKIFKHFYDFNITGGAFDPRVKKEAFIEINHLPFKEGKIHLNEVSMRIINLIHMI